jgi:hypothetical protein
MKIILNFNVLESEKRGNVALLVKVYKSGLSM